MAAVPFKVKAIFEYTSSHEDDLAFRIGQIITVTDEEDADWYGGEYLDDNGVKRDGIFPRNFVERYEPTAPPRPIRARKKDAEPALLSPSSPPPAAVAPPEQPVEEVPVETASEDTREETRAAIPQSPPVERSPPAETPSVPVANPPEIAPVPAPAPIEPEDVDPVGSSSVDAPPQPRSPSPVQSRFPPPIQPRSPPPMQPRSPSPMQSRSPPPVSVKPKSNAFRDRIAAFNKPAAPPIAPFKPSGLGPGSSSFIKKPFVAPPPSRHAYVPPPPRDPTVPRVYRREKDPEAKDTQAESADTAEKAGHSAVNSEPQEEEQPKPTTLKERIALLQKQQAESAQRHVDAVVKKEKPVRPPKKTLSSNGTPEAAVTDQVASTSPVLERKDSADVTSKDSMDEPRSAGGQFPNIVPISAVPVEGDGHEAVVSGAGDSTKDQEIQTLHDDNNESPDNPNPHEGAAPEEQVANEDEEEEEDDDDIDPEIRRKEELRARMAKMSGGMGMAGMFGPPSVLGMGSSLPVKKPKPPIPGERRPSGISERPSSPGATAPPVPTMMALPGMGKLKQPEENTELELKPEPTEEEIAPEPVNNGPKLEPELISQASEAEPPISEERPAPPPIPTASRPLPPPPPPAAMASPSVGSESDDEMSESTSKPLEAPKSETSPRGRAPPPIPMTSPRFPSDNYAAHLAEEVPPASPGLSSLQNQRNSRPPPPIPGVAPPAPLQSRPPPPLPPSTTLSRVSTADELIGKPMEPSQLDNGEEEDVTEYEGDYDTDIPSSTHHKDALKAHARGPSFDDNASIRSPAAEFPSSIPPPVPSTIAPRTGPPPIPTPLAPSFRTSVDIPRAGPPPIPTQPPPRSRASVDIPRAAPPPPPPKPTLYTYDDDDYDPYNYNTAQAPSAPSHSTPLHEETEEYAPYHVSPPPLPSSSTDHRAPPLTPTGSRIPLRKSADILRPSIGRRSIDATRHSVSLEAGFMANEIDLSTPMQWWISRHGVPPVFQGRKDIYTETNETKSTDDGRKFVTKEVLVLFQDYSQTIITIHYDPKDSSQTELDQRHEPPPRPLRQDELEEAYERFGRRLAHSVASKKDIVVGDGTPHALIHDLLRPLKDALLPVGSRSYGALVYANLANAATQMNDEIRPGDIISIRNAKFQGKHGPMHAKYTIEVGKPDHVAIVAEWDGTKKKVRAWEQGRGGRKVKQESYKLDDLRSGEVKIWRVMPRTWVGWGSKD